MKAFTKFCLILSGVLIILGFAGIGASLAMGVRPSQLLDLANHPGKFYSKKLEIIENIEDSISPITEHVDSIDDINGPDEPDIPFPSGNPSSDAEEYYEFDNRIDELDFELALCDLKIYFHDEDFITLEAWNTGNTFQCIQDEYTLHLEDDRDRLLFQDSMDQALYLKLYLPKQTLENVDFKIGAGNITLDQLASENMDIQCGAGEMTVKNLSGGNIDIQIGVGELKADMITAAESCTIESGTGNITLNKYDGTSLDLNCGLGDISVTAVGKQKHYDYELNCTAGEIRMNHHFHESEHHHEEEEDPGCHINMDNQADRNINMQCGLGDIELNFTEED